MKGLIYAGIGLGAAYLLFGTKQNNAPLPEPPAPALPANTPAPAINPAALTTMHSGTAIAPALSTALLSTNANIGAATYGNCQCKDGSFCVGQGNCACCDKSGGAIHTIILPVLKKPAAAPTSSNYSRILG